MQTARGKAPGGPGYLVLGCGAPRYSSPLLSIPPLPLLPVFCSVSW